MDSVYQEERAREEKQKLKGDIVNVVSHYQGLLDILQSHDCFENNEKEYNIGLQATCLQLVYQTEERLRNIKDTFSSWLQNDISSSGVMIAEGEFSNGGDATDEDVVAAAAVAEPDDGADDDYDDDDDDDDDDADNYDVDSDDNFEFEFANLDNMCT